MLGEIEGQLLLKIDVLIAQVLSPLTEATNEQKINSS